MENAKQTTNLIDNGKLIFPNIDKIPLRKVLKEYAGEDSSDCGAKNVKQGVRLERTVTIAKPPEELYRFWRHLENLPLFMKQIESVKTIDDKRSHWIAKDSSGYSVEWDARVVKEEENKLIAWISIEGEEFDNSGFVRFLNAPGDRGTEVKLVMEYYPNGGAIAIALIKLFGKEPEREFSQHLRRFKQLMEACEIATTEGQPCRRK